MFCAPTGTPGGGTPNLKWLGIDSALYYDSYTIKSDHGWAELLDLIYTTNNQFNNIDKNMDPDQTEYSIVSPCIKGKEIAHFVNRLPRSPLLQENYLNLGIKHIQFNKAKLDYRLKRMKKLYQSYGLTCHCLPKELLKYKPDLCWRFNVVLVTQEIIDSMLDSCTFR